MMTGMMKMITKLGWQRRGRPSAYQRQPAVLRQAGSIEACRQITGSMMSISDPEE
jgi:hypothetical protein